MIVCSDDELHRFIVLFFFVIYLLFPFVDDSLLIFCSIGCIQIGCTTLQLLFSACNRLFCCMYFAFMCSSVQLSDSVMSESGKN